MTGDKDRAARNKLLLLRTRDPGEFELDTLIAWTRDRNDDVRDWATFVLGSLREEDGEDIRQALLARMRDDHFDTRCEALFALAQRQDERALPALIEALSGPEMGSLLIEAADSFARRELVPALEALRAWWDVDEPLLAEAIAHCRSETRIGKRVRRVGNDNDPD